MYPCKANKEGEYCEMPAESGGYCRYHQKILPKNKKVYPCMKSHKSKKYNPAIVPNNNQNKVKWIMNKIEPVETLNRRFSIGGNGSQIKNVLLWKKR